VLACSAEREHDQRVASDVHELAAHRWTDAG